MNPHIPTLSVAPTLSSLQAAVDTPTLTIFRKLERSNDCLPFTDIQRIQNVMEPVRTKLEHAKDKVQQLKLALDLAEQEHKTLEKVLSRFGAEISPVRRLPAEILTEILLRCIDKPYRVFSTKSGMPWVISRVCGTWRAVAQRSPGLWIAMEINNTYSRRASEISCDRIELLREALRCSGNLTLDITLLCVNARRHLDYSDGYDSDEEDSDSEIDEEDEESDDFFGDLEDTFLRPCKDINNLVINVSHRWRSIRFPFDVPIVFSNLHGRIPELQSLRLPRSTCLETISSFEYAPLLRLVDTSGGNNQPLRLPWSQITRLSLHGHDTNLNSVLVQGSQLRKLLVHKYTSGDPGLLGGPFHFEPFTHHELRSLTVPDCRYLKNLTFPSLRELVIAAGADRDEHGDIEEYGDTADLVGMTHRFHCHLNVLSLHSVSLTQHLFDFISSMPQLRVLVLEPSVIERNANQFFSSLFHAMTPRHVLLQSRITANHTHFGCPETILPWLFTLEIAVKRGILETREMSFVDDLFVKLIDYRVFRGLQMFHLDFDGPVWLSQLEPHHYDVMSLWPGQGLDFRLATLDGDGQRRSITGE
ncbi:hypothetical protein C8J56DRAFT_384629 [Mycena floridula]|nr:hypothetical protein C8J56DRAFT_384629 [Mycena floridula]